MFGGAEQATTRAMTYIPSRTLAAFHKDNSYVRAIMGPIGSGKTVGLVMEVLNRAVRQRPYNGVRYSRWLFVRKHYPDLIGTTIRTFQQWVPSDVCPIKMSTPIVGTLKQKLNDGTEVHLEVQFLAIDSIDNIDKVKSLELTGVAINEASELDAGVLTHLKGRIGRYPTKQFGGPSWTGIIMDTNPPPMSSWFYKLFEEERPAGHVLYKQPPALIRKPDGTYEGNPWAENINNLEMIGEDGSIISGYDYYFRAIEGENEDYINVMILGQYGALHHGTRIYPQYDPHYHFSRTPLKANYNLPIYLGFDWGLRPACVVTQLTDKGCLTVLDEITPQNISLERLLDEHVLPLLRNKYPGYVVFAVGDSALQRSHLSERSAQELCASRGITVQLTHTNKFEPRKESLDFFLDKRGGFLLSSECKKLHEALSGGYVYSKNRDRPDKKNDSDGFTDVVDAIQYVALYLINGGYVTTGRVRAPGERKVIYV